MVEKEVITAIFDKVLSMGHTIKCGPTIAEMRETLSEMSHDEQFKELKDNELLNPLEIEHYQTCLNVFNNIKEDLDDPKMREMFERNGMLDREIHEMEFCEEQLFQYGRRLIEGLETNPVPTVDGDYVADTQYNTINSLLENHGELETKQIELQKQEFNKQNTTQSERHSMDWFFSGDLNNLNRDIYGFENSYGERFSKKLDYEQKKNIKDIDNLMRRSPPLSQDTIFYRVGHFDIHLKPGDHSTFKGYTSTTFQKKVTDAYKEDHYSAMSYVIHAPKGTKGLVGDCRPVFNNDIGEHEYTLPRNTGFTVLSIDYDTMTCEILLDGN